MTAVLIVLGLIAIVVGILGTIYPALPGLGLMFGGAWLLGYAGDYQVFGSGRVASVLRGVSRQGENVLVDGKKQPTLLGCRFYFLV